MPVVGVQRHVKPEYLVDGLLVGNNDATRGERSKLCVCVGGITNCALLLYLSWTLDIGVVLLGGQLEIMVWSSGEGAGPEIKL